jgi:hypothetical protein
METILLILILAISLICVFEYILIHRVENDTGDLWCEIDDINDEQERLGNVIDEHERNLVCLADAQVKANNNLLDTNRRVSELENQFESVAELIALAKDHESAAAKSEKLFHDGLESIMNYSYETAVGKKDE